MKKIITFCFDRFTAVWSVLIFLLPRKGIKSFQPKIAIRKFPTFCVAIAVNLSTQNEITFHMAFAVA